MSLVPRFLKPRPCRSYSTGPSRQLGRFVSSYPELVRGTVVHPSAGVDVDALTMVAPSPKLILKMRLYGVHVGLYVHWADGHLPDAYSRLDPATSF